MDPNPSHQNHPPLSGAADKWHWQVEMVSTPSNRKTWLFIFQLPAGSTKLPPQRTHLPGNMAEKKTFNEVLGGGVGSPFFFSNKRITTVIMGGRHVSSLEFLDLP